MTEQDEQQKLQGYLRAQSAKLSAVEIRDRIQEAAEEFLTVVGGVAERVARTSPAAGEWSLADIVDHVITTEERIAGVMRGLVEGRRPSGTMDIGARSGLAALPWADLLARLKRSQAAVSGLLAASGHEPHLDLRVNEGYFGDINWKGYALILRLHYKDHTGHARKTLGALGPATRA